MRHDMSTLLLIAVVAIAIVCLGVMLLADFAYKNPLAWQNNTQHELQESQSLTWKEVYMIGPVSKYKYEVISIYKSQINRTTVLYSKNQSDGMARVDFLTYEGVTQENMGAGVLLSAINYKCQKLYYRSVEMPCSTNFSDGKSRLAAEILPTIMGAEDALTLKGMGSAVYNEKTYQALMLMAQDNQTIFWVVNDVPLPVRMEKKKPDGSQIIANLKSYE